MFPFDYVIMLFATHFLIVFCSLTLAHVVIVICYVSPNFNPLSTDTEMFRLNLVNTVAVYALTPLASFTNMVLTLIPVWISNHLSDKMWDEITYPFLNFNGSTVEV